jgi:subtilisin family serine protease
MMSRDVVHAIIRSMQVKQLSRLRNLSSAAAIVAASTTILVAATQSNPPNWGLKRIDQPENHAQDGQYRYAADGTGVKIYIIGTGVNSQHEDFKDAAGKSRVTYVGDFCLGYRRTETQEVDAFDGYDGHETHIASYAAGALAGVAKNAKIYSLRTRWQDRGENRVDGGGDCPKNQSGERAAAAAIDWIRTNGRAKFGDGPAVVNFSAGGGNEVVQTAILKATSAGYLFTLSAGTGGPVEGPAGRSHWGPCSDSAGQPIECVAKRALVVGGTRANDTAIGSDYGPFLSLFAPAEGLHGAGKASNTGFTIPEQQCAPPCRAGDSFAAPWVAGVAAVFLEKHPTATPSEVRSAILKRAAAVPGLPQKLLMARPR